MRGGNWMKEFEYYRFSLCVLAVGLHTDGIYDPIENIDGWKKG